MPKRLTTEQFIAKAKIIHNDKYDYSLTKFINSKTKVKIICPIHGEFEQFHDKHLSKKGCSKCGFISRCKLATSNTETFIKKAKTIHGEKYNYSSVIYTGKENKVDIICKIHEVFKQTPHNHLAGNGCPICNESKGETIISNILKDNTINYIPQKRFNECRNILPLPFDFYLPEHNTCIEYQGIQHFEPRSKFGGEKEFVKRVKCDEIKFNFCKNNNIQLLLITYKDNIQDVLTSYIANILK
jgi:hypothetical protein